MTDNVSILDMCTFDLFTNESNAFKHLWAIAFNSYSSKIENYIFNCIQLIFFLKIPRQHFSCINYLRN